MAESGPGSVQATSGEVSRHTSRPGCSVGVIGSSLAVIFGGTGQAVLLPLLVASLGDGAAGAYTTLILLCLTFVVLFGIATVVVYVTGRLRASDLDVSDAAFALIGLCDCLNGLLTVFSSALGRTPGALQATLPQLSIPLTLAASYCLFGVGLTWREVVGASLVVGGILVSVLPAVVTAPSGGGHATDPLYPLLFAAGVIPGVLTNVLQTGIYRRHPGFNKVLFLFYRSAYQALFAAALFWTDLLPGLGTSTSLQDLGSHMSFGVTCLFHPDEQHPKCYTSWWIGALFAAAYIATYAGGAHVIEAASANFVALISTATTPLAAVFWFAAPASLLAWAGGSAYSTLDLVLGLAALFVLIVPGSLLYKLAESRKRAATGGAAGSTELVARGRGAMVVTRGAAVARGDDDVTLSARMGGLADLRASLLQGSGLAAAAARLDHSDDDDDDDAKAGDEEEVDGVAAREERARQLEGLRYLRRLIDAELARASAEATDAPLLVYVR